MRAPHDPAATPLEEIGTTPRSEPDAPRVVVAVDGSATAAHALEVARAEAELMGASLEIVWAWTLEAIPSVAHHTSHTWADAHVAAWAAPALAGPRQVTTRALWGAPGPKIVEAADGAALVVVGARALGDLGFHLGSVSRYVLDHCTMPVMVVRDGTEASPVDLGGPIVVGIDGSTPSRRALDWALREAARRQVDVVAVHGWEAPAAMVGPVPTTMQPANVLASASERLVAAELDAMQAVAPTVRREGRALCRGGSQAILDEAATSSLVVVGCRGRGSLLHRALGSVSHQVVAHSPVPVVAVR
ncbi:universal stress protein [Iamia sp. SCSIO 61187]|uniref:universal stress protein n=1 Tax=Iamia sp. SCSIO 61187 TaxID=2722752 RepID=UPI001C628F86|nr:universal stress protein [Iamia sp. SCSIO 61187]QYG93518.1 universal stress protein [Iamia sp. SCSIO 61187]